MSDQTQLKFENEKVTDFVWYNGSQFLDTIQIEETEKSPKVTLFIEILFS